MNIKIVAIIAALERVSAIASIRKITNKIFKFLKGFLIIYLIFFNQFHRHNNITGRNAIKKYP